MYPSDEKRVLEVLPSPVTEPATARKRSKVVIWLALLCLALIHLTAPHTREQRDSDSGFALDKFFWTRNEASSLCPGVHGNVSYSGYIGLDGDSDASPRRSFYWLFQAQESHESAPVVLTIGGGPGSSGLLNPLFAQSHCKVAQHGTVPNPNAWSETVNLLALDHPIGVGYSHGRLVNNSRDAAHDVYDFLQKFYAVYPQFAANNLVLASGSYGGIYIPHIATVIHEHNKEIAAGRGPAGARHINLESLMLSNPMSDARSWFAWHLQNTCHNPIKNLYNETQCDELYQILPKCLEDVQFAYDHSTPENRLTALETCMELLAADSHGVPTDNIKHRCESGDPIACNPDFGWALDFLNSNATKAVLGAREDIKYESVTQAVYLQFVMNGDHVQQSYLLYEPLLGDGIRILHYLGKLDTIAGWPGTLSFLRLIDSPFAEEFRDAPDVPWPHEEVATVRAVGPGAGNFTLVFVADAGHFVAKDQPALSKLIMEHWTSNKSFFKSL